MANKIHLLTRTLILVSCLLLVAGKGFTQSGAASDKKKMLEIERKQIEKEIAIANRLLKETQAKKEKSLAELKLLQQQIVLREELVMKLNGEVGEVSNEIGVLNVQIDTLKAQILRIQTDYGKLAYAMYKSTNQKPRAFYVFSAKSFNDGFNRIRYFQEFSRYQTTQLELIRRSRAILERKKLDLEGKKLEKEQLMNRQKLEQQKLGNSRKKQDELYKNLKQDENNYQQQISEKQKQLNALKKEIQKIIEAETAAIASKGNQDILLPLSQEFKDNQGKLPWPLPTSKGVITARFGKQTDVHGLEWDNTGIDIATTEDQEIRAVFGGKVVQLVKMPGFGNLIVLQHGQYYTAYTNLKTVSIAKGDQVEKLQSIGTARTDKASGETTIHFEMYQGQTPINPEAWLVRKK
ncbi:MAG: peptidoglycan DD-metalloendopeptidase family protein [Bacteroidia bacterium]|nr:peptidoglycan DD-metalloendopeptidase family protein [Bacteroidia bacterium]